MLVKFCALLAVFGAALAADYDYIRLVKEEVLPFKPFLKCEAKLNAGVIATEIKIIKLNETFEVELVKLDAEGLLTNDLALANGTMPDKVAASGLLDQESGLPYLKLNYPFDQGVMEGLYKCHLTYTATLRDHERAIASTELSVGEDLKVFRSSNDKLKLDVDSVLEHLRQINIRQMVWPIGDYSLLKPRKGCPKDDLAEWAEGIRTQIMESDDADISENSTLDHMPLDLFYVKDTYFHTNLSYCSRPGFYPGIPYWPMGSYCVNKLNGACPFGFQEGSILFDDEDDTGLDAVYGELPDGEYTYNTLYKYCCRNDTLADKEIFLPVQEPFYLYRYNGKCQKVAGMKVTNDYIVFDTANYDQHGANIDKVDGFHPDATINPIRLELCYYERCINH